MGKDDELNGKMFRYDIAWELSFAAFTGQELHSLAFVLGYTTESTLIKYKINRRVFYGNMETIKGVFAEVLVR